MRDVSRDQQTALSARWAPAGTRSTVVGAREIQLCGDGDAGDQFEPLPVRAPPAQNCLREADFGCVPASPRPDRDRHSFGGPMNSGPTNSGRAGPPMGAAWPILNVGGALRPTGAVRARSRRSGPRPPVACPSCSSAACLPGDAIGRGAPRGSKPLPRRALTPSPARTTRVRVRSLPLTAAVSPELMSGLMLGRALLLHGGFPWSGQCSSLFSLDSDTRRVPIATDVAVMGRAESVRRSGLRPDE